MRRPLAVLLVTSTLIAGGCSSSGGGSPKTTTSAAAPASGPAKALATKLAGGIAGLKSAHLAVDAGALGGKIAGTVTFSGGTTTGSDLTIDQGAGVVEVITVGGTSYAKPPAADNTSGKPWVEVSASSKNEFVRGLAGTLSLTGAATSLGGVSDLLAAATTSVKDAGSEQVDGVTAEHYALTIDPSKATGNLATTLSVAGSTALPVDLWLDAQNRPVQLKISIPLGGQTLPLVVHISRFDAPATITAPPADQVSSD